jgi:hypothetical protein
MRASVFFASTPINDPHAVCLRHKFAEDGEKHKPNGSRNSPIKFLAGVIKPPRPTSPTFDKSGPKTVYWQ